MELACVLIQFTLADVNITSHLLATFLAISEKMAEKMAKVATCDGSVSLYVV